MRTCLTITLLLWASLASQAQAAGALPIPRGLDSGTAAICAGHALSRPGWQAAEQPAALLPATRQLAVAEAAGTAVELPVYTVAPCPIARTPRHPRAP